LTSVATLPFIYLPLIAPALQRSIGLARVANLPCTSAPDCTCSVAIDRFGSCCQFSFRIFGPDCTCSVVMDWLGSCCQPPFRRSTPDRTCCVAIDWLEFCCHPPLHISTPDCTCSVRLNGLAGVANLPCTSAPDCICFVSIALQMSDPATLLFRVRQLYESGAQSKFCEWTNGDVQITRRRQARSASRRLWQGCSGCKIVLQSPRRRQARSISRLL
jgi:hypothetical protein